ncbi:MAG: polyprenyl diphosphate synthase [Gammaproteobacteria bacterium]|nr:polyprenyl diphosphate synthase [Gammaproteobacteria bacterium]
MADERQFPSSTEEIPDNTDTPNHVAIIMDGNGRWANRRGLPRIAGHRQGLESVRNIVKRCVDRDVPYLTLFAFSSENWRRPPTEVNLLMELFTNALENKARRLHENQVRLRVVGDLSRFSSRIRLLVERAEALTRDNRRLNLTIAANYGGRWDIEQACAMVCRKVVNGELSEADVTSATIEDHLSTRFLPEPDLFIRTGGEQRISNFLLWQLAYTELYFTETLWPEFDDAAFDEALASFARRQRRFGQTGDQIQASRKANNA